MTPHFIRKLDYKHRLLIPGCIAPTFGPRVLCSLLPDAVLIQAAEQGRRLQIAVPQSRARRVQIPAEHRQRLGFVPGQELGLTLCEAGLLVWALPAREGAE